MEIAPIDAYELIIEYKKAKDNYFDIKNVEYDSYDELVFEYENSFSIELNNTYERKWEDSTFRCVDIEPKDKYSVIICAEDSNYDYPEDFIVAMDRNNIN